MLSLACKVACKAVFRPITVRHPEALWAWNQNYMVRVRVLTVKGPRACACNSCAKSHQLT